MTKITIDDVVALEGLSFILKDIDTKNKITQRYFNGELNRIRMIPTYNKGNLLNRHLEDYNCAYERTLQWNDYSIIKKITNFLK